MSIEGIKNAIVSAVTTGAEGVKTAVLWCGHKISYLFNDILFPFAKNAWGKVEPVAKRTLEGLRTGIGIGSVLAATGLTVLLATHLSGKKPNDAANTPQPDPKEWDYAKVGLTVFGAALMVGGVVIGAIFRTAKVI